MFEEKFCLDIVDKIAEHAKSSGKELPLSIDLGGVDGFLCFLRFGKVEVNKNLVVEYYLYYGGEEKYPALLEFYNLNRQDPSFSAYFIEKKVDEPGTKKFYSVTLGAKGEEYGLGDIATEFFT